MNTELMPELLEANKIKYIFNAFPLKIHKLVHENDRVWRGFVKILRGERNYMDVSKGFGKWTGIWNPLTTLLKYTTKWQENSSKGKKMK